MNAVSRLDINYNRQTLEEKRFVLFTFQKKDTVKGLGFCERCHHVTRFSKKADIQRNLSWMQSFKGMNQTHTTFLLIPLIMLWGNNYSRKNIVGNHEGYFIGNPRKDGDHKDKF